ncbi:MAG: type II toxin-antitoxin system Phd/YefM family antitoxin [Myxococcales bacterium]|nr:type II toxin-antitoxin system Phd/YefM family antitoxin [Myxococcales bacterium]
MLATGEPLVIERRGRHLQIAPVVPRGKLARLSPHAAYLEGDPDALIHADWSCEWKP